MMFNVFFVYIIVAMLLTAVLLIVPYGLGAMRADSDEIARIAVYECGFEEVDADFSQFSTVFLFIGITFLVFDIEFILLYIWPFTNLGFFVLSFFLVLVLGATLLECYSWIFSFLDKR